MINEKRQAGNELKHQEMTVFFLLWLIYWLFLFDYELKYNKTGAP